MLIRCVAVFGLVALSGLPPVAEAAPADCATLVAGFNAAVRDARIEDAQGIVDRIAVDDSCATMMVAAQRRLSALRLGLAQARSGDPNATSETESLLVAADRPQVLWQAAATLGEFRFGQRRFADAAAAFDRAIEIIKNEGLTPKAPSPDEIAGLVQRGSQARLLAAEPAPNAPEGTFAAAVKDKRDGTLGGVYSQSIRGVTPRTLPLPVTFVYGQAAFTSVGEQAARELLTALREQRPDRIILVGHTDPRGTPQGNLRLSVDRARAVAKFLADNGLEIPVETVGKGQTEPLVIPDRSGLTEDDIFALNRRVEWRRP
jgi:outer membrane protein OmpA-like peptidoglycan-associated protein